MSDITYKVISGRNFMVIPCSEAGKNIDTQLRMLAYGGLKSILPITPTTKNGISLLQYDITGLTRLSSLTQYGKLSHSQFSVLIEGLLLAMDECASCALNGCGVRLEEDSIYYDSRETSVRFAYLPTLQEGEPAERCRELLRNFIAYGKVENGVLLAAVTDTINRPTFNFILLRELLSKYGGTQPQTPTASAYAAAPPPAPPVAPLSAAIPAPAAPSIPSMPSMPAAPPARPAPVKNVQASVNKNRIIILATVLVSLAAAVGICMTPFMQLTGGGPDVTKILGICIAIAAIDFLFLRKLPKGKENAAVAGSVNAPAAQALKTPALVPIATPTPARPVYPQAMPAPASSQHPSAVLTQTVFAAQPDSGDTVMMDDSLYLQTAKGEIIALSHSPFRIGRDPAVSDYVITDETVGHEHAQLSQQGNGWAIIDQNSRNHTSLNGTCLVPFTPYPLSPGDTILIARVTLWVKGR